MLSDLIGHNTYRDLNSCVVNALHLSSDHRVLEYLWMEQREQYYAAREFSAEM